MARKKLKDRPSNWTWDEPGELRKTRKQIAAAASALTQKQTVSKGWADEGKKADDGKLPYDLLPSDAIEEIVKVLDFGAKKYAAHNWCKGMRWGRVFAAMMRHGWAWWRGEDKDPETGLSHLAHLGCCCLFLLAFEKRGVGTDDRYKKV